MSGTNTAAPDDQSKIIDQMLQQALTPPRTAATGSRAQVEKPSSFIGLLGSALGGGPSGSVPMSADEADASGNRALLNFGLNLLANSGYSTERKTIGQLIGGGMGAAQQSMGQSEYMKAARGQAQQDYAAQQQELQIARVKEALPLLTLQQQIAQRKALQNMPSPFGNTNIGASGAPGKTASAEVPPELMPHYEAASRETGIPVAVLIAKDKQESGFNNALVGGAKERGIAQIHPDTAAAPGFGMKPIAEAQLVDPGQNILFGARYLKARGDAAGVKDWNNPDQIAKALLAYNGGGDKNYVANVMRYYKPGAAPGAPPATATTAPPAAAGAPPARPVIPASNASGGTTAEAAPAPGSAQFAGPGAPTNAPAPQPSPGAAGNANAIMAGMVARGADPTTLAPTGRGVTADEVTSTAGPAVPAAPPGSVPAQTGGLVVPAGVTPPPGVTTTPAAPVGVPSTFEEFQKQHPIVVPPEMQPLFNAKPDAEQLSVLQRQAKLAETAYNVAKATGNTAGMEKALGDYNTIMGQENTVRENAAKLGRDAQAAWVKDRIAQQHDEWKLAVESENKRQDALTTHQRELEKQTQQGNIQANQSKLTSDLASRKLVLDQLNKEAMESRGAASQLDGLAALSNNVDKPSAFATLKIGDTTVLNRLAQAGIVDQGTAGATQLLQSGISNTIAGLRSGMSMGALSDRDLNFIESMAPNLYENKETRAAVISYLRRMQDQKMRYNVEVNKLTADGMPISEALAKASATMEEKAPIVPIRPQELGDHWLDPDPEWKKRRIEWARENNIRPGTMFRKPNGGLEIIYTPGMAPVAIDVGGAR